MCVYMYPSKSAFMQSQYVYLNQLLLGPQQKLNLYFTDSVNIL